MSDITISQTQAQIINSLESQLNEAEIVNFVSDLLDQASGYHLSIQEKAIKRLQEDT